MSLAIHNEDDDGFELDPTLRAVAPRVAEAIAYWERKRGNRIAPTRRDFTLRETKSITSHLQIVELIDGGPSYHQRLTGTAIVAQLGEDPTGRTYESSSSDPVVHRMLRAISWVIEKKKPLRTFARRTALREQDFFSHETVFLPLSSDGERIDMIAIVSAFTPVSKSK